MKRLITFSIIALFIAACSQNTPEEKMKKAQAVKIKISKLEKELKTLQTAEDTIEIEKVFPVKVNTLMLQKIDKTIEYSANLIPFEELYMAPAQPGKISAVYVEIGDKVSKGQKLVEMDQTQLEQAKIQLSSLEKDFARIKTLKETGSIPEQQYDQIKTQLDVTKTNVEFLEKNTVLVAPYNGIITGKYFENNEIFGGAPNTQAGKAAIVILQQIDVIKAVINVSEQYYTKLQKGTKVNLSCDNYPSEVFEGEIMNVYPTIDAMTRSFKVEIKVPNKNLKLRPGMFTRVNIILGQAETILVPSNTVLQQEGTNNRYIFINKDGLAKKINVTLGQRFNDSLEIISDELTVGDQLIVAGHTVLMNNNKVNVIQ